MVSKFSIAISKLEHYKCRKHVAAAFVLVDREERQKVLGFYTLSATSIRLTDLPHKSSKSSPNTQTYPPHYLAV